MDFAEDPAPCRTVLHRLDPRVKWLGALAFSVVTAVSRHPQTGAAALAAGLGLLVLSRPAVRTALRRFGAVNLFVAFLWIVLPFTAPGRTAFSAGGLAVTREGLLLALAVTLKSNAIVAVLLALPGTSSVFENIHALHHLRVPGKLVQVLFFTFRYVHVIAGEYGRLRTAMALRGFRPRTDLHTYRSCGRLLGMLFVRSFERSERIHEAMLCRGFRGVLYTLDHFRLRARDGAAALLFFALAAFLGAIEWTTRCPSSVFGA